LHTVRKIKSKPLSYRFYPLYCTTSMYISTTQTVLLLISSNIWTGNLQQANPS